MEMLEIPITAPFHAYLDVLEAAFGKLEMGLAEENLQARIRGNILMAISNRYGHLVIATGNKSEMACGYATLYGDMAGGFALLKDVFKTEVYDLARYRNSGLAGHPRERDHEAAFGGAATRSEGLRLAAALRRARPDPRGVHRRRRRCRRHRCRRVTIATIGANGS